MKALKELYYWSTYKMNHRIDFISEVGIDQSDRLFVRPRFTKFDFIYRSAMEVHWDKDEQFLFGPRPRKWTYLNWYEQIVFAAKSEYGVHLKLTSMTDWTNIPEELGAEIIQFQRKFDQ